MKWFNHLKNIWNLHQRIALIESEINEIDTKLKSAIIEYSKDFEKKIQEMTFAYTRNLDDTKSDYLKRYVEVRLDSMGLTLNNLGRELESAIKISQESQHYVLQHKKESKKEKKQKKEKI